MIYVVTVVAKHKRKTKNRLKQRLVSGLIQLESINCNIKRHITLQNLRKITEILLLPFLNHRDQKDYITKKSRQKFNYLENEDSF